MCTSHTTAILRQASSAIAVDYSRFRKADVGHDELVGFVMLPPEDLAALVPGWPGSRLAEVRPEAEIALKLRTLGGPGRGFTKLFANVARIRGPRSLPVIVLTGEQINVTSVGVVPTRRAA